MEKLRVLILFFSMAQCHAGEFVQWPLKEFKSMYQTHIEQYLRKSLQTEEKVRYTIDRADYQLAIGKKAASGHIQLSGKWIEGEKKPIPLFDQSLIITSIKHNDTCQLIINDEKTIALLPLTKGDFSIDLGVLIPVQEDERSQFVAFQIPKAVSNSLTLSKLNINHLLEIPGVKVNDATYKFSPDHLLRIRFENHQQSTFDEIELDVLTEIRFLPEKIVFAAHFLPMMPINKKLNISLPDSATIQNTSLKPSWFVLNDNQEIVVSLPFNYKKTFSIQYAVDVKNNENIRFQLPHVQANKGLEKIYTVFHPEDKKVLINNVVSKVSLSKYKHLKSLLHQQPYFRLQKDEKLHFDIQVLKLEHAPKVVLTQVYFFTSFTESGESLSTLILLINPGESPHLRLKRIPGADIWSLKVNEQKKSVYSSRKSDWIIPLTKYKTNEVALSFVRKSDKLKLSGKLQIVLPEIGIAAQNVHLGLALPKRIQLAGVEGDFTPSESVKWPAMNQFNQMIQYHFSRAVYRGDAVPVSIYYKEPVAQPRS